jgi:hypothetical protein
MRKTSFALAIAGILGGVLVTAGQSRRAGSEKLHGTWRLVSTEEQRRDGTGPISHLGPKGTGYLIYAESGRMCAVLMNPTRANWLTARYENEEPSATELRSAFGGFRASCGTYEVDQRQQFVTHQLELDFIPNALGEQRKHLYTLTGDRLVLHPSPPPGKDVLGQTYTWERVR